MSLLRMDLYVERGEIDVLSAYYQYAGIRIGLAYEIAYQEAYTHEGFCGSYET